MRQVALILSATAALTLATASGASAANCRDANGKFVKCPAPAAAAATTSAGQRCRDAKGAFVKCPAKAGTAAAAPKAPAHAKAGKS